MAEAPLIALPIKVLGRVVGVELIAAIPGLPKVTFTPTLVVEPSSIIFCKFDLKFVRLIETVLEKLYRFPMAVVKELLMELDKLDAEIELTIALWSKLVEL